MSKSVREQQGGGITYGIYVIVIAVVYGRFLYVIIFDYINVCVCERERERACLCFTVIVVRESKCKCVFKRERSGNDEEGVMAS